MIGRVAQDLSECALWTQGLGHPQSLAHVCMWGPGAHGPVDPEVHSASAVTSVTLPFRFLFLYRIVPSLLLSEPFEVRREVLFNVYLLEVTGVYQT